MLGAIDAFMREGLELDSAHLEANGAGLLESRFLFGAPSACLDRSDHQSLDP
jgi:hypothetical protein